MPQSQSTRNAIEKMKRDASAHRKKGEYNEAIERYTEILKDNENDTYTLSHRGELYALQGNRDLAKVDLKRVIERKPDMRHALINLAEIAYEENNLDEALAYIHRALEKRESYWGLILAGKIHKKQGNYKEAVRDFSKAYELDPTHIHAIASRGEMYRASRAFDKALDDFNKALEISPKNAFSLVRRADIYMKQKNSDHAAIDLKTVSELSLSTGENMFAQSCLHKFAGDV